MSNAKQTKMRRIRIKVSKKIASNSPAAALFSCSRLLQASLSKNLSVLSYRKHPLSPQNSPLLAALPAPKEKKLSGAPPLPQATTHSPIRPLSKHGLPTTSMALQPPAWLPFSPATCPVLLLHLGGGPPFHFKEMLKPSSSPGGPKI